MLEVLINRRAVVILLNIMF